MRGQILGLEEGRIVLLGADDVRRVSPLSEWRAPAAPQVGQWVDFLAEGDEARHVYPIPHAAPPAGAIGRTSSSTILGAAGVACLVGGIVIPIVLPTLAALVLGIIGAGRAQEEHDQTGLLLSRIAWIGALILIGLGFLIMFSIFGFLGLLFGTWVHSPAWPPIST